jgi:hypothetical protein
MSNHPPKSVHVSSGYRHKRFVESQTNTPPDQLSEAQIFQNTSSGISRFFVLLGTKGIVAIKRIASTMSLIHHHQRTWRTVLRSLSHLLFWKPTVSLLFRNQLFCFGYGSGKGFFDYSVFPANSTFLAYSKWVPTGVFTMTKWASDLRRSSKEA